MKRIFLTLSLILILPLTVYAQASGNSIDSPITILGIIGAVFALFAYIIKLSFPYFLRRLEEKDAALERKDEYIRKITNGFLEANNHKTTEFTKAIDSMRQSHDRSTKAVEAQTEVFKQLIRDNKIQS